MKIGIMLLLSMFFYEASFAQKYSDKIIINSKVKKQFKYRDTCVAVFDAFKDCRCFLDTVKNTIDIEARGNYDYNLHFQIKTDLSAKVEHVSTGDVYDTNDKNPFPPFPIKDFLIETDKNPFTKSNQGFLLKYRFGENRRPTNSEYPDKTNEFTGFINCHNVTVHQKKYDRLSSSDSVKLAETFLNEPLLLKIIKLDQTNKIKYITGAAQEWQKPISGFKLLKYEESKKVKEPVISIVVTNVYNQILNGSQLIIWTYWNKGVRRYFSAFEYQKFTNKWVFMNVQYIHDLKTKKYLHLK